MEYQNKLISLDDLHPDQNNARIHDRRNIDLIKNSLATFGQYRAFVVRSADYRIVVGNGMYQAMKELGWNTGQCFVAELTDEQARILSIADNRASDTSDFTDNLAVMLDGLDEAMQTMTGFTPDEIAELKCLFSQNTETYIETPREQKTDVVRFVFGKFHFTVSRKQYQNWLKKIAADNTAEEEILKMLGVQICN